ncbi:MAG: ABC transporter ATP-binding protein [Candidatus Tectomicrobia bacterium]|nr:ABC transporter ATP-binding protein [Candidatus Tectomicrobia bacterium]
MFSRPTLEATVLSVDGIDVAYGVGFPTLRNVSLRLPEGEIIALVGSNGAGKTTLLNTISGLLRPSRGGIRLRDTPLHLLPPHEVAELGIAHVPEGRKLFPMMTVEENLHMGAYTRRSRPHLAAMIESVYDLFPVLRDRRRQYARTLSGGEQQMVAIGRGLMSMPEIIMFDEPSLGLAPLIVREMFEVIKRVNAEGKTVFLVEQNVRFALGICHYAYILEQGQIIGSGKGQDLLNDEFIQTSILGTGLSNSGMDSQADA